MPEIVEIIRAVENPELVLFRDAVLEKATGSATDVIRLSFASEHPVLRQGKDGKYWEVLSHSPGDANLGLLNSNGLLLCDHDETREIGEIVKDSARVESDKRTRADIKITESGWKTRVDSNEQPGVSVGYRQLSVVKEERNKEDGIPILHLAWAPYEISLLNKKPADPNVGLYRSAVDSPKELNVEEIHTALTPEQKKRMKILLDPAINGTGGGAAVLDETAIRSNERSKATTEVELSERERAKEITIAADTYVSKHGRKDAGKAAEKIRAFQAEAIGSGEKSKDFNTRAMQYIINAEPERVSVRDDVPGDELAQFSVMKAIQSAVKNRMSGREGRPDEKDLEGGIIKHFETKCREAGGVGYETAGFIVPPDVQFGNVGMSRQEMLSHHRRCQNRFGRDMQATIFGQGGAAVPTFWQLPYIEILRNKSVLNRLGMRSMAGLTGNIVFPRLEASSTAYSVAEIAALAASQQTLGQVAMTPHRVGNTVNCSKQLIFQSSTDIQALIQDDMTEVLALKKDYLGLNGQGGASEPLGIMQTPGIGAVTFGATPTYIKMVLFETLIRNLNVMGRLSYASTSATKGSLKTVAEALTGATTIGGAANAIWKSIGGTGEEDGIVNGCQAVDSQQIPGNQVLSGVFNHLMEAMFGGFDFTVDYFTKAVNAEIAITMNLWLDYAARHPQAFAVSTDAGNQ